ncbi:MAG: hypothetical protein RLZZ210_562, partial [Pseudomonadota bacterium]
MYKFNPLNLIHRFNKFSNSSTKDTDLTKLPKNNIENLNEYNLSRQTKLYQASQAIYIENIQPDVKSLAQSLIYVDDARIYRLSGNKKLRKIAHNNVVNSYIKGVNNYLPSVNLGQENNTDNATKTRKAWESAGKYSYLKGRSVTAGGHISTVLHNLAYCGFSALKDASISSAFSFIGPIATLVSGVLYRPIGDAVMGLIRPYNKVNEEVYSTFGFPSLNQTLEKGENISTAIKRFNQDDLEYKYQKLEYIIKKLNDIKNHSIKLNRNQTMELKQELLSTYELLAKTNSNIKQLRAARGREKIEFEHNLSTLKINSLVTAGNVIAASIGTASVAFAPQFSPLIKLGAAVTTFGLTLTQYFLNSYLSGKNLAKKFEQTIYENIKSELGSYYKEGKDVNNIRQLKKVYDFQLSKLEGVSNNQHAIKNLTKKYESELHKIIDITPMTNWWYTPTQRSMKIANEWIDSKIQEKLYKLMDIRIKYIERTDKSITQKDSNQLKELSQEIEKLLYDKEIINNLRKRLNSEKITGHEITEILKLAKNEELLDIFVDNKVAAKCMIYVKKSEHNGKLKDFASYFGPGLLTSIFTSTLVGTFCATTFDTSQMSGMGQSKIPAGAILSAINHSMCLSASNNRAEAELVKHQTIKDINRQSRKKQIFDININLSKSSSELVNRLLKEDDLILELFRSKDINLKFEQKNKEDILVKSGCNNHHVYANKLDNTKYQLKFFGKMMLGGIREPFLQYHKARKLY